MDNWSRLNLYLHKFTTVSHSYGNSTVGSRLTSFTYDDLMTINKMKKPEDDEKDNFSQGEEFSLPESFLNKEE